MANTRIHPLKAFIFVVNVVLGYNNRAKLKVYLNYYCINTNNMCVFWGIINSSAHPYSFYLFSKEQIKLKIDRYLDKFCMKIYAKRVAYSLNKINIQRKNGFYLLK